MNPEEFTREADIIIAAVGQPNMVRGNWIKPGAVIIDVGINPVEVGVHIHDYVSFFLHSNPSFPLPKYSLIITDIILPSPCPNIYIL